MAEISVVIPVYNVEKYLRQCLDSIRFQTFKDLEIICVDDGSDDSSLEILEQYKKIDSRFKIFKQNNEGPSSARNTALDNACGKYIYFMDSDDVIEVDALEKLYDIAESNNTDIVIFKLINFNDETGEKYSSDYYDMEFLHGFENRIFSYDDVLEYVYRIAVSLPGKFYRADLLSDIRFEEGIIFEDNPFFVESLFKSERLYFLNEYLYNRRVRPKSITTSRKNFTDFITVSDMLIDIAKRYNTYEKSRRYLFRKILNNMYLRFLEVEEENRPYYFERMKANLLAKKEEYDSDEVFQSVDARLREIYYRCIESQTAKEFELYMKSYDLNAKFKKAIKQRNKLKRQRDKLADENKKLKERLDS